MDRFSPGYCVRFDYEYEHRCAEYEHDDEPVFHRSSRLPVFHHPSAALPIRGIGHAGRKGKP